MNISADYLADLIAKVARIDEKTDAILVNQAKGDKEIEATKGRVDVLEKDKSKLLGIVMAISAVISFAGWFGGDFVKAQVFGEPVHAQTIQHNQTK